MQGSIAYQIVVQDATGMFVQSATRTIQPFQEGVGGGVQVYTEGTVNADVGLVEESIVVEGVLEVEEGGMSGSIELPTQGEQDNSEWSFSL